MIRRCKFVLTLLAEGPSPPLFMCNNVIYIISFLSNGLYRHQLQSFITLLFMGPMKIEQLNLAAGIYLE